ncbi:MAG TPA: PfkB family carbohydrate kinase [Candidatus Fimivivens sp.]|nr:PfkB family carbohydrate kinase [Candidatus Fimivivens sp.]
MITAARTKQILDAALGKHVLACGDIMLDAYFSGEVERFSQEAPVPVIPVREERFFPGGAGNSAACMAVAGITPHLVSVVGSKERFSYSDILRHECEGLSVVPHFVTDPSRKTTLKLRLTANRTTNQHIARVDMEDTHPLDTETETATIDTIRLTFDREKPEVLSIHDYKKGFLTEDVFRSITTLSLKHRIPIFADLKQETFIRFRHLIEAPELFYLKPNKDESVETARLIRSFDKNGNDDEEIIEIADIIRKETPINIVITRGDKGAVLFEGEKEPYFVRLTEVEQQFDVAGAGDTVEAFLVTSFLGGATLPESLEIAVAASQIAIRKFGTSVVTPDELLHWIDRHEKR